MLCLPPHEQAWRGFVCVTVWIAEQSWFTGQWTEVGWVQVSVSWVCGERFPEVAAGWGHFLCLKDLIHQGSTGSCLQQSFQTLPLCLTKLEKFVILSAVRVPATATCSHDRYRCQTRHRPIFFWQDHSDCIMAEPGQEWIPVWEVPVMQTVPAGDLCLWFR